MLNRRQIAWAAQHDWFVSADIAPSAYEGTITVRDEVHHVDTGWTVEMITWSGTFAELRAWAGY